MALFFYYILNGKINLSPIFTFKIVMFFIIITSFVYMYAL